MAKDRKVIQFTGKYKKSLTRTTPNDLRAAATGTLGLILFVMLGLNFTLFDNKSENRREAISRGIASVPKVFEPQWKRNIEGEASTVEFKPARKPSPLDNLNFGLLEGKYSLKVENGHVVRIRFMDVSESHPSWVDNREEFIEKYSPIFVSGFQSASKVGVQSHGAGFKETYRVKSEQGESVFEFYLDQNHRFLSLQVK